ncbi:MAG: hypothetical protein AAGG44_21295, partial [Planctomycetota bacterium]
GEISKVNAFSDQYSLGVVLFHLLTGETPCSGAFIYVISEVAKGHDYSASERNREIDRDLDAICAKAMSGSVERRYASCSEFAADLLAWFERRPVVARPLSSREKLARLFHQHKAAVATGVAFISMLILSTIISLAFAFRAIELKSTATEAQLAQREATVRIAEERDRATAAANEAANAREAERQAKIEMKRDRDRATKAANDANVARKLAEQATREARASQRQADAAKQQAELSLERTNYFLALAYTNEQRYPEARQLLESVSNQLRGLEWYAAKNELNHSDATFRGHERHVNDVCCPLDGSKIVSAGVDGTIRIWETESTKQIATLGDQTGAFSCLDVDGSGNLLASGGGDHAIRLWDLPTRTQVAAISGTSPIYTVSFGQSRKFLVSVDRTHIRYWDLDQKKEVWARPRKKLGNLVNAQISQLGAKVLVAGRGYAAEILDAATGKLIRNLPTDSRGWRATFNYDGSMVFFGYQIVDIRGNSLSRLKFPFPPSAVAAHPHKNVFAAGFANGMIGIVDSDSGTPPLTRAGHASSVLS